MASSHTSNRRHRDSVTRPSLTGQWRRSPTRVAFPCLEHNCERSAIQSYGSVAMTKLRIPSQHKSPMTTVAPFICLPLDEAGYPCIYYSAQLNSYLHPPNDNCTYIVPLNLTYMHTWIHGCAHAHDTYQSRPWANIMIPC